MNQSTLQDFQSSGIDCPACEKGGFGCSRAFNSHWGQVHEGDPPEEIDTSYGEHSKEHRENLSNSLQGRELSKDTRRKVSEALSGRTHDPEVVEKRVAPQREKVETSCANCGGTLERHPCRLDNHEKQFCNQDCHGEWISHNVTGENHPRFNGGPVGFKLLRHRLSVRSWQDIASEVRKEYNHTCQMCGKGQADCEHTLEVHHIVPLVCGGTNDKENLIPLCMPCHRSAESYTKEFTEPHLLKYTTDN